MDDLAEARSRLPLPDLMKKMGYGDFAKSSVKSPFREERNASWGIYQRDGRWRYHDHGEGQGGDEVDFIQRALNVDRKQAIEQFKNMAGIETQKRQQTPTKHRLNGSKGWEGINAAATDDWLIELAKERKLKATTMAWAKDIGILGNRNGFPAFRCGEGCHHKVADGTWRFDPPGRPLEPLVFGPNAKAINVFESQWDALAIIDAIGVETAKQMRFIITRGAGNGSLIEPYATKKKIYAWPQNDLAKSNGKVPSEEWMKAVIDAGAKGIVLRVNTPREHKDANEWVAAGATAEDISRAIGRATDPMLSTVEVQSFQELNEYKPEEDETTLIGNRWLCEGGQLLLVGQSGIGKSSLSVQAAMMWALGRPFFGIAPKKPLRSLFVQAENDAGDMAEIVKGVISHVVDTTGMHKMQALDMLQKNIMFARVTAHVGEGFVNVVGRLLDTHGERHLVFADPLLSYVGGDINRQEIMSEFLRQHCNPLAFDRRFAWVFSHHTGKPQSDSKARQHWNTNDYAYIGLGSSELTNWARAIAVLQTTEYENTFRLLLAKRGRRAGVVDDLGQPETVIALKHADKGLHWEATTIPEEPEQEKGKRGRPSALSPVQEAELVVMAEAWETGKSGLYDAAAKRFNTTRRTIQNKLNSLKTKPQEKNGKK